MAICRRIVLLILIAQQSRFTLVRILYVFRGETVAIFNFFEKRLYKIELKIFQDKL